MCCFNNGIPGPGATKIGELEPGDRIVLLPGYGDPPSKKDRVLIVVSVSGYSALCDDGTTLAGIRNDGLGITVTGRVSIEEVVISEKAQELLKQAEERRQQKDEAELALEWLNELMNKN